MTFDAPAISILLATAAAAMKGNVTPADLWGTAPDYAWSQLVSLIRAQNWSGLLDYLSSGVVTHEAALPAVMTFLDLTEMKPPKRKD